MILGYEVMNLSKTTHWETLLLKYDPVNSVLFGQWTENKVISFMSTLVATGMTVKERIGVRKFDFQVNKSLEEVPP